MRLFGSRRYLKAALVSKSLARPGLDTSKVDYSNLIYERTFKGICRLKAYLKYHKIKTKEDIYLTIKLFSRKIVLK